MKIYINNEEVVCSNVLEITEEMLQTSSTILDNCYPKSWEETHEYTTQFYFPKDYSKCKIYKDDELIFCGLVIGSLLMFFALQPKLKATITINK